MEQRVLGRTGRQVSVVGLGPWQLAADWGHLSRDDALAVLRAAADAGVRFFRTADVYGDGRSEQFIGEFLRERGDTGPPITVATKMTRTTKSSPYRTSRYTGRPGRRRERSTRGGADGRPHLGEVLIEHLEGDVGQQRGEDSSNSVGNWGVFRHPSRCRGCRECRDSCCAGLGLSARR